MTTNPFMIFLNNWELNLNYQHFLLDPYPFQGMIREPTPLWASFLDIFGVMVLSDTKWSLKHISDDYV